jgi:hypothetical protein
MTVEELRQQMLKLDETGRAELARDLLLSLDQGVDDDVAVEWIQEIEDRSAAYQNGEMTATPWREAVQRIEQTLSPESSP